MLTAEDTKIIFQSHMYRLRILNPQELSPYLLLAILNTSLVKRQIRSKQFTQDIIDTLGGRIQELVLPIPRDERLREEITQRTREIVETRARLRGEARDVVRLAVGNDLKDELAEVL